MEYSEQRRSKRHAFRLPCTFRLPEGDQAGFITNISSRGFFIQTRCSADSGMQVVVTVQYEPDPAMLITGAVVRARRSPLSMTSLEQPGIGIKIETAPDTYYQLIQDLEQKE